MMLARFIETIRLNTDKPETTGIPAFDEARMLQVTANVLFKGKPEQQRDLFRTALPEGSGAEMLGARLQLSSSLFCLGREVGALELYTRGVSLRGEFKDFCIASFRLKETDPTQDAVSILARISKITGIAVEEGHDVRINTGNSTYAIPEAMNDIYIPVSSLTASDTIYL